MTTRALDTSRDARRGRLARLSAAQLRELAERLRLRGADVPRRAAGRLVACVVAADGRERDDGALRDFARQRLAEYMVPQSIVWLDALPRTPTGKLDRDALADAGTLACAEIATAGFVAPASEAETVLADIWSDVLGLDEVSVDDDFFEVGGDSLLSIRILARANQAGLRISPEQFFSHPTIAAQAGLAQPAATGPVDRGPVTGLAPLTPIQHWFFERITVEPDRWNQAALYAVAPCVDRVALERAVQALLDHHDALRSRFVTVDGELQQEFAPLPDDLPIDWVDFPHDDLDSVEADILRRADAVHGGFRIDRGPLLRFVYWSTPGSACDRLLVVAHHLTVDAVSWRLLAEDLDTLLARLRAGAEPKLPARSTPLAAWARRLRQHADSDDVRRQKDFWESLGTAPGIPLDLGADPAENIVATMFTVTAALDEADTGRLLTTVPQVLRTRVDEALLTAFAHALTRWTGAGACRFDVEGHGREAFADDLDLSRTVGWLTTVYPVALEIDQALAPTALLASVKQQLRAIPARGFGFGLVRWLAPDADEATRANGPPDSPVCFNYLGQVDRLASATEVLTPLAADTGTARAPAGRRAYLVEVNARVESGRLIVECAASDKFHRRDSIAALADGMIATLGAIISAAAAGDTALTAGDFPLADLDAGDLEGLARIVGEMDDPGRADD